MDPRTGLTLLAASALTLLGVRLFWRPLRWVLWAGLRIAAGAVVLYAWNAWSPWPHWSVAVNPATGAAVGWLGVPGFLLLLAAKHLA